MLASLAFVPMLLSAGHVPDTLPLRVTVDSARHEVLIEYRVAAPPRAAIAVARGEHADHDGHGGDHSGHAQRLLRFEWPIEGWLRGARVELEGADGEALPQERLHHINLLNFDRRQLVHPAVERLYAAGQETAPVLFPPTVGTPLRRGSRLGLLAAFAPGDLPTGSLIRLRLKWMPMTMTPRPMDVYPVLVDAGFRPGESPAYDLPPGHSVRELTFTVPLSGRILAAGGHMHDYGVALTLEEVGGSEVFTLRSELDDAGRMRAIPLRVFGVTGRGRPLRAGREYRLRVEYHNTTGAPIPEGAMGEVALLFAPDRRGAWPEADPADPLIAADLEGLSAHERATH
ncbi:MAG TPA: hypothetical protein VFT04_06375 [Gemmatimonadales bacterium]|nr:hypothetical protein [Gemmatimonadales bacterium]